MQIDLHHSIHRIFRNQLFQQLHAHGVGRHNGAANTQVPLCNGCQNILRLFIYHLISRLDAAAVFKAHHGAAMRFNGLDGLFQHAANGAARYQDPFGMGIHLVFSGSKGLLDILPQTADLCHPFLMIKKETGSFQRFIQIITLRHGRILLLQLHQGQPFPPLQIAGMSRPAQSLIGDR